jgi:hypothetical protein
VKEVNMIVRLRTLMRCASVASFLLVFLASGIIAFADGTTMQWDLAKVDTTTSPFTILAGGTNTAAAVDGSTIRLTGSGTFVVGESDEVTGGGTWTTVASDGITVTGTGTYNVTGLVRFDLAPGTFSGLPLLDGIGDPVNARPGLTVLRIAYSDGSRGLLVVSCHLFGTPAAVFEGSTATKGFVDYLSRKSGSTLFHVIPENEN